MIKINVLKNLETLEKPTCSINDVYVQKGEEVHMICECKAFPPAVISWSFVPCNDLKLWPECKQSRNSVSDKYK